MDAGGPGHDSRSRCDPGGTGGAPGRKNRAPQDARNARFQAAEEFAVALGSVALASQSNPAATLILRGNEAENVPRPRTSLPLETDPGPDLTPRPAVPQTSTVSKSWDPAVLEAARMNLALFVGPMAKVLVNRAAKNARNVRELYQALTTEIEAPADREKFLRSQPH